MLCKPVDTTFTPETSPRHHELPAALVYWLSGPLNLSSRRLSAAVRAWSVGGGRHWEWSWKFAIFFLEGEEAHKKRGPSPAVRDTLDGIPWEEVLEKAGKGAGVFLEFGGCVGEDREPLACPPAFCLLGIFLGS